MSKLLLLLFIIFSLPATGNENKKEYIKRILTKLESIESASYQTLNEIWAPGDTIPRVSICVLQEYNNPADTTIGASFVTYNLTDTLRLSTCYDGKLQAHAFHPEKGIMLDDFTTRKLPFRVVTPPFFSLTKTILRYILETKDNITVELEEGAQNCHLKLTINESQQIEFFGKDYRMDTPSEMISDPTSIYEIWINKSDDLPYKYRREMCHSTNACTCKDVVLNRLSIQDFKMSDHFPKNYEVRKLWERVNRTPEISQLTGQKAPDWSLVDMNGKMLSLADIKSKVILINFTGIGCGPCKAAIPFLIKLRNELSTEELELVAVENWEYKLPSLLNYAQKNNMNYVFLEGNKQIIQDYLFGSRGVPAFFILDQQRIIRKVIKGYGGERTNQEITDAIKSLL